MGQTQTKFKNKRRPNLESKEEYFIKNGGILLEKQIALSQGQHKGAGQLKIFSSREIKKATDCYNPDLIVGSRAYGIIYKTTIEGRIVAVKAPPQMGSNQIDPDGPNFNNQEKEHKQKIPGVRIQGRVFHSNGGVLLEKYIALSQGRDIGVGQLKIFSMEDIAKATCNYDPDLIVGRSNLRNVIKTTIDGHAVAVRVPPQLESSTRLIDHHLTEASMAMVMNHVNIEKLIGCCLESLIPILVHEFVPNRSLFQHLHDDIDSSKHIQWPDRLKIANDIAYALSYMHNALSKAVVHRYLDSHIILLDFSFHAKLANFGYSVPITPGETPQKWPIAGAPGYIDPEYIETQEVTAKCDVYSFGVLMLELLTRRQPIMMARYGNDLVDAFKSALEKNCIMEMIDSEVLEQATRNEICQVAQLALACVADKGIERPTMIEVCMQLRQIRCCEEKISELQRGGKSWKFGMQLLNNQSINQSLNPIREVGNAAA